MIGGFVFGIRASHSATGLDFPRPLLLELIRSNSSTWSVRLPSPFNFSYHSKLQWPEIRLIELHGAENTIDPIICKLSYHNLDEKELNYTALSYVWGDSHLTRSITCNGQNVTITESLYAALVQFRARGFPEPLWADALCINQADLVEKTDQVRNMRDIYRRASQVVVWLGEEQEGDFAAFALMRRLDATLGDPSIPGNFFGGTAIDLYDLDLPHEDSEEWPDWAKLQNIFVRPWFERIWTVQEYLSNENVTFWSGPCSVDGKVLLRAASTRRRFSEVWNAILDNISEIPEATCWKVDELLAMQLRISKGESLLLYFLLLYTENLKATDPRDKVFAMLRLASDVEPPFVDYSRSIEQVQLDVAKHFMASVPAYWIQGLSHRRLSERQVVIPTWVKSWCISSSTPYLPLSGCFYTSEESEQYLEELLFGPDEALLVRGKVIDVISLMCPPLYNNTPFDRAESNGQISQQANDWFQTYHALIDGLGQYPTGESLEDVLWRNFMLDRALGISPIAPVGSKFQGKYSVMRQWLRDKLELREMMEAGVGELGTSYQVYSFENALLLAGSAFVPWFTRRFPGWLWACGIACSASVLLKILHGRRYHEFNVERRKELSLQVIGNREEFRAFLAQSKTQQQGRLVCKTKAGYVGWAPMSAVEGDQICVFKGCDLPFVIRCRGTAGYHFVGDCYVHGLMDGVVWNLQSRDDKMQDLELI